MIAIFFQFLAALAGTIAFALLFGVPRKYYSYCGLIGGLGWLLYCCLDTFHFFSTTELTFFSTILVVLLSRFCAVHEKCPATVFLISGIIPLVPGANVYWTSYYLVTNNLDLALSHGFAAIKTAIAIVLGIVLIFEIPYAFFRIRKKAS